MSDVVIDTNIVVWYFTKPVLPTQASQSAILSAALNGLIYVSAVSIIELTYLIEKKRLTLDILSDLRQALDDPATAFQTVEISREIADELASIPRSVVPDMPDRIIAATSLYLNIPMITADKQIQRLTNIKTIW